MKDFVLDKKLINVDVDDLLSHPYQPRVNLEEIETLKNSILEHGLINPPIVERHPRLAEKYYIVAGHRRVKALREIGIKKVEVFLVENPNVMLPLIDNVVRKDLSKIEIALHVKRILDEGVVLTRKQLAEELGFSVTLIARMKRIASMSDSVIEMLLNDKEMMYAQSLKLLEVLAMVEDASGPNTAKRFAQMFREMERESGFSYAEFEKILRDYLSGIKEEEDEIKIEEIVIEERAEEEDEEEMLAEEESFKEGEFVFEEAEIEGEMIEELEEYTGKGYVVRHDAEMNKFFVEVEVRKTSIISAQELIAHLNKIIKRLQ